MDTPTPEIRAELAGRLRRGALWLHAIAALSLLNSVIALFAGQWNFIFGLGLTQVFDAVGQGLADDGAGPAARLLMLAMSAGAVAPYVLCGWLAARGKGVGFLAGMTFYALDGAIFLLAGDWLGTAFHVIALMGMGRGYGALRALRGLPTETAERPATEPAAPDTPTEAIVAAVTNEAERGEPVDAAR